MPRRGFSWVEVAKDGSVSNINEIKRDRNIGLCITSYDGDNVAEVGDWVIKENDEIYFCSHYVFKEYFSVISERV